MDRGAWWATVHGVAKSQTRLSDSWSLFTFGQLSCFDTPISPTLHPAVSLSEDPALGVPAPLSQDGFHCRGIRWGE